MFRKTVEQDVKLFLGDLCKMNGVQHSLPATAVILYACSPADNAIGYETFYDEQRSRDILLLKKSRSSNPQEVVFLTFHDAVWVYLLRGKK